MINKGYHWSGVQPTPEFEPSTQAAKLFAAGSFALGAAFLSTRINVGTRGETAYDLVHRNIRNIADSVPLGMGNTFRTAESMSPWLSPAAQGLKEGPSVLNTGKQVFSYNIGSKYTGTQATRTALQGLVGEETFAKSGLNLIEDGKYELRFERTKDSSKGNLFFRQVGSGLEETPFQWKPLGSDKFRLQTLRGPGDVFDVAMGGATPNKTSVSYAASLQHIGVTEKLPAGDLDKIFSSIDPKTGKISSRVPFGLVRSGVTNTFGTFFAQNMQRFNKLLEATAEQVPVGRGAAKALADSLQVQPGPAHKMFAKFGLKAGALGAAYLGVQEIDHFRRNSGLLGQVGVAAGTSAALHEILRRKAKSVSPRSIKHIALASFFGQLVLPGFDQGFKEGLATSWKNLNIGLAGIGQVTGASAYRRTIEGFAPGLTDATTGAFAGVSVLAASYLGRTNSFRQNILNRMDMSTDLGKRIAGTSIGASLPRTKGQHYIEQIWDLAIADNKDLGIRGSGQKPPWQMSIQERSAIVEGRSLSQLKPSDKSNLIKAFNEKIIKSTNAIDNSSWLKDELYSRHQKAINLSRQEYISKNSMNQSLINSIENINSKYGSTPAGFQRFKRFAEVSSSKMYHAFFGASMSGEHFTAEMERLNAKGRLGRVGTLFFGAFLAHQFFTGGLFGSMEGPGELSDIYSGKKLVEVKSGRWWEGGGSPFEGKETKYLRPHWYHTMMSRSREKATWGANEDQISPITKWFKENFTYDLEKLTYYDRPYVQTGAAFQHVPLIGGVLASTIGQLIKPSKLMHTNEWIRPSEDGGVELAYQPEFRGPDYELGGLPMGTPESRFSSGFLAAELQYRTRELSGLPGWAKNVIQKQITGYETFGQQMPVFGQAGAINDPIEKFWELNLGGALFTSEPVRRLLPNPRKAIEEYNPIVNRMPSWMPKRFHYGDPYRKVESGFARLPGPGYEALHPELAGTPAENYPLIYQHAILSDLAPTSKQANVVRQTLYDRRSKGITSGAENAFMDNIDAVLAKKMVKRDFNHVKPGAIELPGSSLTQGAWQATQSAVRGVAAPFEYMVPMGFRPAQKLLSDRDMIEQYEYERMYGTMNAFWDKPWRDWFRPAIYSAAELMGYSGKPEWRQDADDIQGYFDKLEFSKWMQLAANAENNGERNRFLRKAQGTRFGVNPQGDAMSIYRSMPDSEKKFFDSFAYASGSDRERILEMIPQDQQHLYQAIWSRLDNGQEATLYDQGVPSINAANLNQRSAEASQYFTSQPVPKPDWIGWHENVEIDDIKLKYIDNLGHDIHDHDMWEKQRRTLVRKPYLNNSDEFLYQSAAPARSSVRNTLYSLTKGNQGNIPIEYSVNSSSRARTHASMYYNDSREFEIFEAIKRSRD